MSLTFSGGIHPLHKIGEGKVFTSHLAVEEMPAGSVVKIPLVQHIGTAAQPVVSPGQRVLMGEKIAEPKGFVSTAIHASVSGTVKSIEKITNILGKQVEAIVIENDFQDEKAEFAVLDDAQMQPKEIIDAIQQGGIVGMGGAAFPLHVKLSVPEGKHVDTLIINGAECEPFLTADHRLMLEQPERIVAGVRIVMRALGVSKAYIGIEDNKPDAIATLQKACEGGVGVEVAAVKTKYPQGSEKQLIDAIAHREVPSGGLPADAGVVVANVASVKAVADYFLYGEPLIRRIVTVTGAVKQPKNLLVRVGTSAQDVIDYVGGFAGEPLKIISGGPMMGQPFPTLDCVVIKGSSGILVLDGQYTKKEVESNCIRCGRCMEICPMHLMPMNISAAAAMEDIEKSERFRAPDCMSCGSCSYVCPAKKPIAQNIKFAKEQIVLNRLAKKE